MNRNAGAGRLLMSSIAPVLACLAAACWAAQPPQAHTGEVASVQDDTSGGTMNRLHQLMDDHQLTELRTTHNASYGASLLFQADRLTYFVVLFHDKAFWRAIQTDSEKEADGVYRTFAAQTEQLAQVDIDTLRLQAGKKYAEQMVAMNRQRLQSLQQDAARRQQQAQEVAALQQQARQQAVSLSSDLRTTSSQLDAVQQDIRRLETQQNDPELALPPAAEAAPAGSASVESVPAPSGVSQPRGG